MAYKKIMHPDAETDIKEIVFWYENKQKGLGKEFLSYFKKEVQQIQKNPFGFEIKFENIRICMIKKFPYLIHFSVYEDEILIKAIYHSSRNPEIWP